jgi:hypothetical protein
MGKKKADIRIDEHALGKEIPRLGNIPAVQDMSEKSNPDNVEARYHTSHPLARSILPDPCVLFFLYRNHAFIVNSIIYNKTARIGKMV